MTVTDEQVNEFLAQTRIAVLSTVDDEGRPHAAPVWFEWRDGAAYVFTGRASRKWRHLQRRPHASLCVDRREPPYAAAVIDGDVEESDRDLYEMVLGMALRYYGEPAGRRFAEQYRDPARASATVLLRIVPRRIAAWDYTAE